MVVCFLLGNSPVSEFYMPSFRNTLFHLYRWAGMKNATFITWGKFEIKNLTVLWITSTNFVYRTSKFLTYFQKSLHFGVLTSRRVTPFIFKVQRKWNWHARSDVVAQERHVFAAKIWCPLNHVAPEIGWVFLTGSLTATILSISVEWLCFW
jgi:hypothetical protein